MYKCAETFTRSTFYKRTEVFNIKINISIFPSELIILCFIFEHFIIIFMYRSYVFHFVLKKMAKLFPFSTITSHIVLHHCSTFLGTFFTFKLVLYLDRVQRIHDTVLHDPGNSSCGWNLHFHGFFSSERFFPKKKLTCCHICAHTGHWQLLIIVEIHPCVIPKHSIGNNKQHVKL